MIIQFLVSLAATLSFAVLFSAEKKTVVFLRSDRCPRLDRLPDLLTVSHRQCDCKPDRHLCTDTGCTDSFGSAQNSGHGVPAHRNLPTCAGIYYTSYYFIMGDMSRFSQYGISTVKVAGSIVLGIIFGFALPQSLFNGLSKLVHKD